MYKVDYWVAIYRFNKILIKTPMEFFTKIEQKNPKFTWNHKSLQMTKAIWSKILLKKKKKLSDFKLYYEAIVTKTVWCCHTDRRIEQWNIIESPKINPYIYG